MRWVLRVVATLILAPPLYRLVLIYLASQQGADVGELLQASVEALQQYYTAFSVPAVGLILLVLTPAERFLSRAGLLLMTVLVSPLLAWPAALIFAHLIQDPGTKGTTGLVAIAVTYGLVWGLSVRETKRPIERVDVAKDERRAPPVVDTNEKVAAIVASNLSHAKPDPVPATARPSREASVATPERKRSQLTKPLLILPPPHRGNRPGTGENDQAQRDAETTADKVGDIVARNMQQARPGPIASGSAAAKVAGIVAANFAAAAATAAQGTDTAAKVSEIVKGNWEMAAGSAPTTAPRNRPSAVAQPDARPGTTEDSTIDKVGALVAANAQRAATEAKPAAPQVADQSRDYPGETRTTAEKIADYWKVSGSEAKPTAPEDKSSFADKVPAYKERTQGREPAPRSGPADAAGAPVVTKVGEIVAANFARAAREAGADEDATSLGDTNAGTARPAAETVSVGDKIAAYWKLSGHEAKSAEPKDSGVAAKVEAYRNRVEGREPSSRAEGAPLGDVPAKVDQIVKENSVRAAREANADLDSAKNDASREDAKRADIEETGVGEKIAAYRERAEARDGHPRADPVSQAKRPAGDAAAPLEPQEKRMPRASPGLELNQRNPLIDKLEAEKRNPR